MGKYEFNMISGGIYDRGHLIPHLNNIANELAEANRLKRWELLNKHKHVDGEEGIYYSINEKELEDQA